MDCIVHGVAKRRTQLSDFHFDHQISVTVTLLFSLYFDLYVALENRRQLWTMNSKGWEISISLHFWDRREHTFCTLLSIPDLLGLCRQAPEWTFHFLTFIGLFSSSIFYIVKGTPTHIPGLKAALLPPVLYPPDSVDIRCFRSTLNTIPSPSSLMLLSLFGPHHFFHGLWS